MSYPPHNAYRIIHAARNPGAFDSTLLPECTLLSLEEIRTKFDCWIRFISTVCKFRTIRTCNILDHAFRALRPADKPSAWCPQPDQFLHLCYMFNMRFIAGFAQRNCVGPEAMLQFRIDPSAPDYAAFSAFWTSLPSASLYEDGPSNSQLASIKIQWLLPAVLYFSKLTDVAYSDLPAMPVLVSRIFSSLCYIFDCNHRAIQYLELVKEPPPASRPFKRRIRFNERFYQNYLFTFAHILGAEPSGYYLHFEGPASVVACYVVYLQHQDPAMVAAFSTAHLTLLAQASNRANYPQGEPHIHVDIMVACPPQQATRSRSRSRSPTDRGRSRKRSRSGSREHSLSRSRSRFRSQHSRSPSRSRSRSRSPTPKPTKRRSPSRSRSRSRSPTPKPTKERSPSPAPKSTLSSSAGTTGRIMPRWTENDEKVAVAAAEEEEEIYGAPATPIRSGGYPPATAATTSTHTVDLEMRPPAAKRPKTNENPAAQPNQTNPTSLFDDSLFSVDNIIDVALQID